GLRVGAGPGAAGGAGARVRFPGAAARGGWGGRGGTAAGAGPGGAGPSPGDGGVPGRSASLHRIFSTVAPAKRRRSGVRSLHSPLRPPESPRKPGGALHMKVRDYEAMFLLDNAAAVAD